MDESVQEPVTRWIRMLEEGDALAAEKLWGRYYEGLTRLARLRLRNAPRAVADEEDAALSAFDSFCKGAVEGRYPRLSDRDDLWKLLVVITERKAFDQAARERRQKRGGGKVLGTFELVDGDEEGRGARRRGSRTEPGVRSAGCRRVPPTLRPAPRRQSAADSPAQDGRLHQRRDRLENEVQPTQHCTQARADPPDLAGTRRFWIMKDEDERVPDRSELPLDVLDQIDRACDRFEAALERGENPRIEDYLGEVSANYRDALERDLRSSRERCDSSSRDLVLRP